jgi:hypothetical protein
MLEATDASRSRWRSGLFEGSMKIAMAQRDMSAAYVGGAPGVFVSGVVWLIAGVVQQNESATVAFAVLFFEGMLIVPASLLIARKVFGAATVATENPLQRLGFEGTIMLFAGIFLAYALLSAAPELAFPALALAIGARYFAFRTIYDEPMYWVLGGSLAMVATLQMLGLVPFSTNFLLVIGGIECAFSAVLLWRWKQRVIVPLDAEPMPH